MLRYNNLLEAVAAAPAEAPFATMWRADDDVERISFGEFRRLAASIAAEIVRKGALEGDKIVLIMPHGVALMAAFLGVMWAGACPALLAYPNFKLDPAKYRLGLRGVTDNLKARIAIIDEAFPHELLDNVARGTDVNLLRAVARNAKGDDEGIEFLPKDPSEIAFIQHSAGTTGLQKAVALTHRAVLSQLDHLGDTLKVSSQDRVYSWLPLYHDMGLIACFMLPLVYHLPVVMQAPEQWVTQPRTMLELVSRHRCTLAWVPNFALQFLARRVPEADRRGLDLTSLRLLINCSEPVRAKSIDEFVATYEPHGFTRKALQASYAMAENVFAVTQSDVAALEGPMRISVDTQRLQEGVALPRAGSEATSTSLVSSGRCIAGNEVRIDPPNGHEVKDGVIGEILIRSDSLFEGYYNRPDLSATALSDGWYRSGDLGFTWNGELYVTGRKKDLIIVAGKNIYPEDIEEIVCLQGWLRDGRAVAFGIFNPASGTEDIVVVAELVEEPPPETLSTMEHTIHRAVIGELGVAIREIYFRPPQWIIKSTAGKPARSATRDKLLSEKPSLTRFAG